MRIWLDQAQDETLRWDETENITLEALDRPEVLDLSPVDWRGQVTFADPGYYLQAKATYQQTLSCIRCLKPIVEDSSADVELLLLTERPPLVSGEHELHEDDLGVLYVEGEELDMGPLLLEQLQLNVPMKPLCRDDCKGLCPVCGKDRNTESCDCEAARADPRWGSLAALKGSLAARTDKNH
jgi:uncharacterized protein